MQHRVRKFESDTFDFKKEIALKNISKLIPYKTISKPGEFEKLLRLGFRNFSNITIRDQNIVGKNLSGIDFTGSTFTNIGFENCGFYESIFIGAKFINVNFDTCNFNETNFSTTHFIKTKFQDSHQNKMLFSETVFKDCEGDVVDSNMSNIKCHIETSTVDSISTYRQIEINTSEVALSDEVETTEDTSDKAIYSEDAYESPLATPPSVALKKDDVQSDIEEESKMENVPDDDVTWVSSLSKNKKVIIDEDAFTQHTDVECAIM